MRAMPVPRPVWAVLAALLGVALAGCRTLPKEPAVTLRPAPPVFFPGADRKAPNQPGETDSNSPLHWSGDTLYVFNSAGHPWRAGGPDLFGLGQTYLRTEYHNQTNGGRWIEATWKAADGTLYGWYHFEPTGLCPGTHLTAPRIGAARSRDDGAHWEDLGIVLEAPPGTLNCGTRNFYFAGGHGDFCVVLDRRQRWLYFFFSTYTGTAAEQGVAVARMRWADREAPVGRVWKWHAGAWTEPGLGGRATPIFPARVDWHREDADAFWGPAIHWNHHLRRYVMLLNRARDSHWTQEGVYVSFNADLSNPRGWSPPRKILGELPAQGWYPQVVGLDTARRETDKLAGRVARLFVRGQSRWEIVFDR